MSTLLIEHGTLLSRLKVSNIVQAAEADLKLRARKRERKADPEAMYSFARKHVQRACSVEHLIALAYFDPKPKTDKRSTLIVYGDRDLLRETLCQLLAAAVADEQVM
jgi:hypothetical protein